MEIRIADYKDKKRILEFIDTYWQKDHIFVRWPELFDDYHRNNDKLNYIIAMNEETLTIYGICGFIYANHRDKPDVWLALWKVIPSGNPSLGLDMVRYLHQTLNCNIIACCGIKQEVKRLYEFLGYKTGTLKHYYRLNENVESAVASIIEPPERIKVRGEAELVEIKTESQFDEMINLNKKEFQVYSPYKDTFYIKKKYFYNIAYRYQVWGIKNSSRDIKAILVTRVVEANDKKVLRIVDFYGDEHELAECGKALDRLLKMGDYEYVDFYQYGLSEDTLSYLGMVLRGEDDKNIIPNHFEPFVKENISIHFFTNSLDNFRMFKADGDQERPNCIRGLKEQ